MKATRKRAVASLTILALGVLSPVAIVTGVAVKLGPWAALVAGGLAGLWFNLVLLGRIRLAKIREAGAAALWEADTKAPK